jgi:hypothetical protein
VESDWLSWVLWEGRCFPASPVPFSQACLSQPLSQGGTVSALVGFSGDAQLSCHWSCTGLSEATANDPSASQHCHLVAVFVFPILSVSWVRFSMGEPFPVIFSCGVFCEFQRAISPAAQPDLSGVFPTFTFNHLLPDFLLTTQVTWKPWVPGWALDLVFTVSRMKLGCVLHSVWMCPPSMSECSLLVVALVLVHVWLQCLLFSIFSLCWVCFEVCWYYLASLCPPFI